MESDTIDRYRHGTLKSSDNMVYPLYYTLYNYSINAAASNCTHNCSPNHQRYKLYCGSARMNGWEVYCILYLTNCWDIKSKNKSNSKSKLRNEKTMLMIVIIIIIYSRFCWCMELVDVIKVFRYHVV